MGRIAGLIFDLDGVLIQSREAHARAFAELLAEFGVNDFHYRDYAGWRTPEVFRDNLIRRHGLDVSDGAIEEASRRKSQRAREFVASENCMDADCVPVIRNLAERYRVALASSGSRKSVDIFLDRSGLGKVFCAALSGDDVREAKPDPEIFSRSIEAIGAPPERCAVVEDAVAGIVAARRAGAHGIGFTRDNVEGLRAAGANCVVGSLRELAGLFEQS